MAIVRNRCVSIRLAPLFRAAGSAVPITGQPHYHHHDQQPQQRTDNRQQAPAKCHSCPRCVRIARQSSAGAARNAGARVVSRFRGRRDPPLIGARSGGEKSLGIRRTRGGRPFVGCKMLAKSHHRRYGFSSSFCRHPPHREGGCDRRGGAHGTQRARPQSAGVRASSPVRLDTDGSSRLFGVRDSGAARAAPGPWRADG